jgi:ATP-dependent RNA helicase DHX29
VYLLNAALVAGLYPKVLSIDSVTGQMRTISNNQVAAFHPTSVNRGRKPQDLGVHHLSFFTLMYGLYSCYPFFEKVLIFYSFRQSKKMYAWETGPVDDIAMLLLCGESEFKVGSLSQSLYSGAQSWNHRQYISDSTSIDRKIRFQIPGKTAVALKHLRSRLASVLALQFRNQPLTESQILWKELAEMILAKVKPTENGTRNTPVVIVSR